MMTIVPEAIVAGTALVVLLTGVFLTGKERTVLPWISLLGVFIATVSSVSLWNEPTLSFNGLLRSDNFAVFFNTIFLLSTALVILSSTRYVRLQKIEHPEYYSLILFACVGMMIVAKSADLVSVFLGIEILSISLYILSGFLRTRVESAEASLKYFLLGAFSAGFFLYGIALIFGSCRTTSIAVMIDTVNSSNLLTNYGLLAGIVFLLVGLGFKVALVPFHMWAPDVYQGAPTPVSGFMASAAKAAGFAAILRIFADTNLFTNVSAQKFVWVMWAIAALTMFVGNIIALSQANLKRMLAYSSIAHAGYMVVGVIAASHLAVLYYLLVYTFMNIGAFLVLTMLIERQTGTERVSLEDLSGMGFKYPFAGICMAIFMLSLAGIPPTAGFIGKFYLFSAAVRSGYLGLAIIGVLNSVLSAYFYLRVIVYMYMLEPVQEFEVGGSHAGLWVAIAISCIVVVTAGIFPFIFLPAGL
jgi:NADH-quinone oxidoreductase subunit N